jgi:hypothetical protein
MDKTVLALLILAVCLMTIHATFLTCSIAIITLITVLFLRGMWVVGQQFSAQPVPQAERIRD